MNHFRTIVSISPSDHKIGLKNGVFTIGSCFAEAIGTRLNESKFKVMINPFGTTYNPISIHQCLSYALNNEGPREHTYLEREGIHLNYDFHSHFSALGQNYLQTAIHQAVQASNDFLKSASSVLVTYGTAWIYRRKDSGQIVNNCHKMPAQSFDKQLLTETEICDSFEALYRQAKKLNSSIKFILTLSPVRHVKDSLTLNSVSKAVVRSACHRIATTYADVEYFPAFEIMMDDLRDYRFYRSDMLHPTEQAEDYIWEKFMACYLDKPTADFVKEWSAILSALRYKPFHPESESHQKFLKNVLTKLLSLQSDVNVAAEIANVESQLIKR
ncbi:MAG TPA: GSCFA domain-containing protein [Chryseosolibacter sp.]